MGEEPITHLGQAWRQFEDRIEIDMGSYVREKLSVIAVPKEDISPTKEQITEYRGFVVRLRWVIAHVVPELAYDVWHRIRWIRSQVRTSAMRMLPTAS